MNQLLKSGLTALLLSCYYFVSAQHDIKGKIMDENTGAIANPQTEYIIVSGVVKDKKTRQPLPFASLSIKGKPVGTVSNQEGEYSFNVPSQYINDTLAVSFLGYKSVRMVISQASKNNVNEFLLEENVVQLKEIVIQDSHIYALDIVKKAIGDFKNVYQTDPFVLESFYREWEILQYRKDGNKKKASIAEAALRIFDNGYTSKSSKFLKETVYLLEVRKIQALGQNTDGTEFGWLLKQNPVNYRRDNAQFFITGVLDIPNKLEYNFEDNDLLEDEEVYVITANVPDFLANYILYISVKDYALLRVDLQAKSTSEKFIHHDPQHPNFRMLSIDNTIRFRRVDGKPFVNYMRMNWHWEKADSSNNREEYGELYKELLVNQVFSGSADVERLKKKTKIPPFILEKVSLKNHELITRSFGRIIMQSRKIPWTKNFSRLLKNPVNLLMRVLRNSLSSLNQRHHENSNVNSYNNEQLLPK